MKYSTQIKPISYLKANAAEILQGLNHKGEPMIITQNGEAKAVLQSITEYENTQETMAILKVLAIGNNEIEAGNVKNARDFILNLKNKSSEK